MPRALWQLLLEDPSDLTCDECFAVMEVYAEALTTGRRDLLSAIVEHLERCPDCSRQLQQELRRLTADPSAGDAAPLTGTTGSAGPKAKGQ